jgi:hypothetical protein
MLEPKPSIDTSAGETQLSKTMAEYITSAAPVNLVGHAVRKNF